MKPTPTSSNRHLVLAAAALLVVPFASSFAPSPNVLPSLPSTHATTASATLGDDADGSADWHRRAVLASAFALIPTAITFRPSSAHALQEKNEMLCNTGFFTNVGAWYCTDIGNIGDEGKSRPVSKEGEASLDSLMGKFDLGGGAAGDAAEGDGARGGSGERAGASEGKDGAGASNKK